MSTNPESMQSKEEQIMPGAGLEANRTAQRLRILFLVLIALNLLMVGVRVFLYRPFFRQPTALIFLLEPAVMLVIYAGMALAITTHADTRRTVALRTGTILGLITGAMWVVNLYGETFTNLNGSMGILSTAPFLLWGFFLWGVAGFLGARRTGAMRLGILSAVWCAMFCVLMTITYGFLLLYTSLPHLQHDLINDPDWLHSGWNDLHAFAIANTYFAGFTHLLAALLVGTIVGAAGSGIGMLRQATSAGRGLEWHAQKPRQLL